MLLKFSKMKKYLTLALLSCFYMKPFAQNLVINPGLENYIICPGFGQFDNTYINNWTKPSWGSTDYYHTACPGIYPSSQVPHGGNAYFGIIAYNFGTEYREYATGELSAPLIAGKEYMVDFYVSLNDGYIQAVKEVSAYFSAAVPGPYANSLHIPVNPQIQNSSGTLGDTALWMQVSGTFTAAGGEQYITIGNFNDDSSTTISLVGTSGSYGAYYFVDDVSVIPVPEGIAEFGGGNVSVYPTLSHGIFNLEINEVSERNFLYEIVDYSGRKIMAEKVEINTGSFQKQFNLSSFSNGIYFLKLVSSNWLVNYKLVKM